MEEKVEKNLNEKHLDTAKYQLTFTHLSFFHASFKNNEERFHSNSFSLLRIYFNNDIFHY